MSIRSRWITPPICICVFIEPWNIGQNNHDVILITSHNKDVSIDKFHRCWSLIPSSLKFCKDKGQKITKATIMFGKWIKSSKPAILYKNSSVHYFKKLLPILLQIAVLWYTERSKQWFGHPYQVELPHPLLRRSSKTILLLRNQMYAMIKYRLDSSTAKK